MTRERSESESTKYERPQQAWTCGHAQDGPPCPLGPSRLGICQQPDVCQPILENDRWVCNRSPLNGGPCEPGPDCDGSCSHARSKCIPIKSLRKRRGIFTFGCFALTLGLAFYAMFVPWRLEVIAPGGLSRNHAQILSRNTHENRCIACHEAGDLTLFELIGTAFSNSRHSGETQSQKCLTCHDKSFDSQHALYAHTLPPQSLSQRTTRHGGGHSSHSTLFVSRGDAPPRRACSTCHREHYGAEHDLNRMTDKQCATCHTDRFDSFSNHPEFRNWPNYQNEQIKFDHASHKFKHFAKDGKTFQCSDCHSLSATNEIIVANGFESCQSCHEERITTTADDGIVFFALPMIDVDSLANQGIEIRNWPEYAQGDFDGVLPPLMRLMLLENESLRPHLELLEDDWDFANLDPDDPDHLQAAGEIAKAIKEVFETLSTNTAATKELYRRALGANATANVDSFLAPFVFQTARSRWFAPADIADPLNEPTESSRSPTEDLPSENAGDPDDLLSRTGTTRPVNSKSVESESRVIRANFQEQPDVAQPTGWFRDDDAFAIGYRPQRHADELMRQLLSQLSAAKPSDKSRFDCFTQLAAPTAAGQCFSCHTVPPGHDGSIISWIAVENTLQGFNKFSHSPHLLQPRLRDCSHCHELSNTNAFQQLHGRVSDFEPITKQDCNSCHNNRAAGDNCTKCHSYHVHALESNHQLR